MSITDIQFKNIMVQIKPDIQKGIPDYGNQIQTFPLKFYNCKEKIIYLNTLLLFNTCRL
jgi:hypothetical protein